MSKLMEGKTAIVLGVWNKWSIAYAIAKEHQGRLFYNPSSLDGHTEFVLELPLSCEVNRS